MAQKTIQLSRWSTILAHRELLFAWTMRIIRSRYQQSILGALWAILQPAATAVIFTTVFSYFLRIDTGSIPYVIFVYSALVPWMLFSTSINDMADSIISNMNLVAKIYFPREILVISALLARLMDFLIAFLLLVLMMIIFKIPIFTFDWVYLPLILTTQLLLASGIGFILAALNTFYRDVRHVVVLLLQIWLYATPIIYPVSRVPPQLLPFYFLNPMAGIIESYRAVFFNNEIPTNPLLIAVVVSGGVFMLGYFFFKRVEPRFADVI